MVNRRQIFAWCLYDWANSPFPTLIITFIFSTYFVREVASDTIIGTAYWGYAQALAGIFVALLSPILGAIADATGFRKRWLMYATFISAIATANLWFAVAGAVTWSLVWVVIATVSFEIGMIFYNALLPSLVPKTWIGRISGWGWGLGYLGGLCALAIALVLFIENPTPLFSHENFAHVRITGPFVSLWLCLFALPLFLWVKDSHRQPQRISQALKHGREQLVKTLRLVWAEPYLLKFFIAYMLYHDGLVTIFSFGGIFAAGTFGFSLTEVLKLGIALNVCAGLGALGFGFIDDTLGPRNTILIGLAGLIIGGTGVIFTQDKLTFWYCSLFLSIFVGPIQAASRSFLAKHAPQSQMTEIFGLYALSGKATTFIGPWLFSALTFATASQRVGFSSVLILVVVGFMILLLTKAPAARCGAI